MPDFEHLQKELDGLRDENLFRCLRQVCAAQGPVIRTSDDPGQDKVHFCSNNYLNLANDPRILDAAVEAIRKYGFGAAASRLISGTMSPHTDLENEFARWTGKENALYFPSGWSANQALLTALPQKGDLVLMDHADHASIVDAVRCSGADFRTYRRDQLDRLEKHLSNPAYEHKYIVTESVFSMDGDCSDLAALAELKNRHNAVLIVDEAHGLGCLGPTGAGLAEESGLLDQVDILVAPLGKAAASAGALIASKKVVIDYLINKARPFIYTTAPSPACAAAALAAIRVIRQEPQRRRRLQDNASFLRNRLREMGLDIGQSTTQIIPVIAGSSEKALALAKGLEERGFFILAIRPPTVPKGTARLRISVQSDHTREQLENLCGAIEQLINL
jgi:8-amino-7-oxononanoate synthase